MRFVHIGDIHLGKWLYQQSLLDIQADLLDQVCNYLVDNDIDVLIMAGDIYDRSIPSNEAVDVLNDFLTKVILKHHKKVLMIAGNHDSASRLQFASGLLKQEGLYIEAYPPKELKPVTIDGVNFYLLPFFKPSYIRYLFKDEKITTYQDAFACYLKNQNIDYSKTNVLITHQFIAGNQDNIRSDSEAILNVGGTEIIDVNLVKQFDYVALGHLHAPQKVKRETMRYSGSLMCYSFDEVNQKKSIVIVDTDDLSITTYELHPRQTLKKYQGTFAQFMQNDFIEKKDDFLAFELLDETIVPHAIEQLRVLYPHLLQITYQYLMKHNQTSSFQPIQSIQQMDTLSLFEQFYQDVKSQKLNDLQKDVVKTLLEKAGEESENY